MAETCEVRDYDASDRAVKLVVGGAITNRPFSSFSQTTQRKIIEWATDKEFASSTGLRIQATKNEKTKKHEAPNKALTRKRVGETYLEGDEDQVWYTIEIENRSSVEMKNIKMMSRIFYQAQIKASDSDRAKKMLVGSEKIDLAPGEKKIIQTRPVTIRDVRKTTIYMQWGNRNGGGGNAGRTVDERTHKLSDRLQGLQVSLKKRSADGEVLERKYEKGFVPDERDWADYSKASPDKKAAGKKSSKKKKNK